MIGVREMHLKGGWEAVSQARAPYDNYKAIDNKPGDTAKAADRVQLSDGKASTEAILSQSFNRFETLERVKDEAGNVTIRCYNGPKFVGSGSMTGFEVTRGSNGLYSGAELKWIPGWDGPGFYSSDDYGYSRAEQQFHQCEARFAAEFTHTA